MDDQSPPGMSTKARVKLIIGAILAVLVVIIMFQNTEQVSTRLLFWNLTLPHVVLLLLMFVFGVVLGFVATTMRQKRRAKER